MTDSLTVFGTDFTGVTGIKATGTGNGTLTYIRPQGTKSISSNGTGIDVTEYASVDVSVASTDFIVTLTQNQGGDIVPTCTFAEIQAAHNAGKNIVIDSDWHNTGGTADGYYDSNYNMFVYAVSYESGDNEFRIVSYVMDANGVTVDDDTTTILPYFQTATRTYTPTTSQQTDTVTFDSSQGYNGLQQVNVTVNAMPSGSATAPATISGTSATVSTGTNTLTLSKTVSVTPSVTAGYVASGTAGNSSVSLTANVTTQAAQTIYPSTSDQTIAASRYLTGAQTIKAVTTSNLTADNIKSGVTVTVGDSADADRVLSVTGTYSGGGGGLTLLQTTAVGSLSTSSTSGADTGKTISLASTTNWQNYDLLVVDISVDTPTNGRHTSTVSLVILTGTSNVSTKNTYTVGSNKWNSKLGSTGTGSTRQSTTAYGVYINAASASSNTLTLTIYYKYNSNSTGTLNGTYTARVYGVNLYDLIGG